MALRSFLNCAILAAVVVAGLVPPASAERPYAAYPEAARREYEKAEELRKAGKDRDAAAAYDRAVRLGMKDYARAHLRQGECFARLREHARAAQLFTRLIEEFGLERSCRH